MKTKSKKIELSGVEVKEKTYFHPKETYTMYFLGEQVIGYTEEESIRNIAKMRINGEL